MYDVYGDAVVIVMSIAKRRSVSDFWGGAEISNGHFVTSAEMSLVRSVIGPKCLSTIAQCAIWPVLKLTN